MRKIKKLKSILVPRLGPRTSAESAPVLEPSLCTKWQMGFNIFGFSQFMKPPKVSSFQAKIFVNHKNFKKIYVTRTKDKKKRFLFNTTVNFQRQLLRNRMSSPNFCSTWYSKFPLLKNTKNPTMFSLNMWWCKIGGEGWVSCEAYLPFHILDF